MSLGDIIRFGNCTYDVRGIVDGRYVVRIRDRSAGREWYKVWTAKEREEFDRRQNLRLDQDDRARQIYDRHVAGETYASLGQDFGISPGRISQICARQARKEKTVKY